MEPSDLMVTEKKNVCIMGRKTWESIPRGFRPLKGRINVVLSSTMKKETLTEEEMNSTYIFNMDLEQSLIALTESTWLPLIDKVFVIGGAKLIEEALELDCLRSIFLTRIHERDFQCDVVIPLEHLNDRHKFRRCAYESVTELGMMFTFEKFIVIK